MLKAMAASSALKYIAACVCPVAGTAAITVGAPKVRAAVHKLTEPPRSARAKPRVKAKASPPATPIEAAAGQDCTLPTVDFVGTREPLLASSGRTGATGL